MTRLSIVFANIIFWPATQLTISAAVIRLPNRMFQHDSFVTCHRRFESSLRLYRYLLVPRWKKYLPRWAKLVGGDTRQINPYDPNEVYEFLAETRRSEIAHWLQLGSVAFCVLWNPLWGSIVMSAYSILANMPCIIAQRYNRILLQQRAVPRRF